MPLASKRRDMPNKLWIAADELLVILVVHYEHVVGPCQILAGDLSGGVLREVVATLGGDAGHGGMGTFAAVPIVGSARADLQVH
jgi:hypothetical protein